MTAQEMIGKEGMEKTTVSDWNLSDEINTGQDVLGILEAALEEDDPDFLLSVLGDIARSKGMAQLARDMNLNRESLYKALSEFGNPSFRTVFNLFGLLGLRVRLERKTA